MNDQQEQLHEWRAAKIVAIHCQHPSTPLGCECNAGGGGIRGKGGGGGGGGGAMHSIAGLGQHDHL